jgi:hypothetical protein
LWLKISFLYLASLTGSKAKSSKATTAVLETATAKREKRILVLKRRQKSIDSLERPRNIFPRKSAIHSSVGNEQ